MDSDPSLSCSDTGDGYPDLSDPVAISGLMGAEDLAASLGSLKEAPELSRLVQDSVDICGSGNSSGSTGGGSGSVASILIPQGM